MTTKLALITILAFNAATIAHLSKIAMERAARRKIHQTIAQNITLEETKLLQLTQTATARLTSHIATATLISQSLLDLASLSGLLTAISAL